MTQPHEHTVAFVGRTAEMTRLNRVWNRVRAGQSELALIAGEAGIGKTRLAREFVSQMQQDNARILWGECIDPPHGGDSYAPFRQALRVVLRQERDQTLQRALRAAGPALDPVLPGYASVEVDGEAEALRARLFEALLRFLREVAAADGVAVVIEDAHWSDPPTVDLITFLSRNLSDVPVLLLLTYRPKTATTNTALQDFLSSRAGRAIADEVTLAGLEDAELLDFVAQLIDDEPDPTLAESITRRSNGNPLFAQQIVAARGSGSRIPSSLKQLLMNQIADLGSNARWLLRIMAVAGQAVPHEVLRTVSAMSSDALSTALRTCIDIEVLVQDPTIDGYAFRHELLQEALYEDLLPNERQDLHRRYANALVNWSHRAPPNTAGAIARHWDRAGDAERALRAHVDAAASAKRLFSFADVERHLRRAHDLCDRVGNAESVTGLSRRHLLNKLIDAAMLIEDVDGAVAYSREALDMVDATREPRAAAFQRSQLSHTLWYAGEEQAAVQLSAEALHAVEDDEPSVEQAWVLGRRAAVNSLSGHYTDARARSERAMAVACRVGAPRAFRLALPVYGSVIAREGDIDAGLGHLDEAEQLARIRGDADEIMTILLYRGRIHQAYARWKDAQRTYLHGVAEAAKYGMIRRYVWRFHVLAARMLFLQGRWDQARAQIFEARDQITGRQATLPSLLIATGAFDEASEFFDRPRSQWRSDGTGRLQMPDGPVELAIWEGRYTDARTSYQRDLELVSGSEELVIEARLSQMALRAEADSVESVGRDRGHAIEHHGRSLIDRLRTLAAGRLPREDGFGTELAAIVGTGECEFLRLRGRKDPEPWAQAVAGWEALYMPYHAAYARWRLGEALAACGDLATADAELADALDATRQLGAAPMADAIRVLRRSVGLPADPPEPASDVDIDAAAGELTHVEQLTRREREVAAVLVEGRSNREIAARLYIAEGTASVHVSRILRKLGVSSRAEAISVLLRHKRNDDHP